MAKVIEAPVRITAAGQPPKLIEEFVGRVATQTAAVSIARMVSPGGWSEPGQTPEFDEFTVVLRGELVVETRECTQTIRAGQGIAAERGKWIRYSSPGADGAEYIAVCTPAFAPETVHREGG